MKKAFLFLALCLLGAGRAAAAEPADSVRNVIYMIGDGMGLAHVSMLAVEGGYAPTAFDRAQGIALISTYSANNRYVVPLSLSLGASFMILIDTLSRSISIIELPLSILTAIIGAPAFISLLNKTRSNLQ